MMKYSKSGSYSIIPGRQTGKTVTPGTDTRGSAKPATTQNPNPKYIPPASVKKGT